MAQLLHRGVCRGAACTPVCVHTGAEELLIHGKGLTLAAWDGMGWDGWRQLPSAARMHACMGRFQRPTIDTAVRRGAPVLWLDLRRLHHLTHQRTDIVVGLPGEHLQRSNTYASARRSSSHTQKASAPRGALNTDRYVSRQQPHSNHSHVQAKGGLWPAGSRSVPRDAQGALPRAACTPCGAPSVPRPGARSAACGTRRACSAVEGARGGRDTRKLSA